MNMKNYKLKYLPLIAALTGILYGCMGKFEDFNSNPFGYTDDMMEWDGMKFGARLAQMQINVFPISQQPNFGDERYQITQNLSADIFSGFMAAPRYWYAGADNTVYALYPGWYSALWDHTYSNIMAPWNDLRTSAAESQPQIYAVAQIVKIEAMHRLTDMYGPLPYSEFGSSLQAGYDSQQAIYNSFFDELDEAVATLNQFRAGNPGATILSEFDYIYQGDPAKWVKFANSLRLRLAMRIFFADEATSKAQAQAALDPANGGVFTENSDNAALRPSTEMALSFHHPLWEICENFDDIRMGATMDCYMNGYQDPRLEKYFQLPEEASATTSPYRGLRTCIDVGANSTLFKTYTSKLYASPGNNHSIIWMGAPEVFFLRAEAKQRWSDLANESESVQTLYESGVSRSMELWGAATGTYLTDATSTRYPTTFTDAVNTGYNYSTRPTTRLVPWSASETDAQKLERILIQKWIALYPDGMEAWSEYRRTGYPVMVPGVSAANKSGGTIPDTGPLRMPFPSSEYRNNQKGLATGLSLLGGADNGGTKLWWHKR